MAAFLARTGAVVLTLAGLPAMACPGLDVNAFPYLGKVVFTPFNGLTHLSMTSRAGGMFNLRDCGLQGDGLTGYRGDGLVHVPPDLLVDWQGEAGELVIGTDFTEPTLLLVHDPEGNWHLDDGVGHKPMIVLNGPAVGVYAIFLGSHGTNGLTRPGTLIISETEP